MGPLVVYTNHENTTSLPNLSPDENPFYHKNENKEEFQGPYNPNYKKTQQKGQKPKPTQQPTKKPLANQDELLQFIHQHPEITNYPSGSVLEIHNVPKPNFVTPNRPQHFIPYVIPQNGHTDDLPPGITLEQILQEVHKNANPNGHILPFPPNQFNNGPVLLAPQSPILPRHNLTYPGLFVFCRNFRKLKSILQVNNFQQCNKMMI